MSKNQSLVTYIYTYGNSLLVSQLGGWNINEAGRVASRSRWAISVVVLFLRGLKWPHDSDILSLRQSLLVTTTVIQMIHRIELDVRRTFVCLVVSLSVYISIDLECPWEVVRTSRWIINSIWNKSDWLNNKENVREKIGRKEANLLECSLAKLSTDLLRRRSSIFLARLAALRARSSFSCSARHRWKFSTTTPTNMFKTKKPTRSKNEMK